MGKLTDIHANRVDGVEKGAIGKRWVLVKSDEEKPLEKDYAGAARAAIEALAKEDGISFSAETVEVLRTLVDLLELDVEFAAKSDESGEGDEDDNDNSDSDEGEGEPEATEKDSYSAAEVEDIVAKALRAAGIDTDKLVAKSANEDDVKPLTKSRQPKAQDADGATKLAKKKGEGLYANIVLGKPTEPFRAGR